VMLSSYDQQLLKMGPDGSDSAAPSPSLPSAPAPAAYEQPAPQYAQPQYQAPPYQQLAGGMQAAQYQYPQQAPYQQVARYPQQPAGSYAAPAYPAPQYAYNGYQAEAPMNGVPVQQQQYEPAQYEQPQYRPYQGQQLYAAPPQYAYQQPEYVQQPYQQPYAYPQPQYAQYPQYAQQPVYPQQQMVAPQQMLPVAPAAPAGPPPTPAQLLEKAKRLVALEHGQPVPAPAAAAPQTQGLAAYSTANPNGGAAGPGGGGLLWRMFTAPEGGPSATAPMNKQYSAVINGATGGYNQPQQQMAAAPPAINTMQSPAQSLGAGGMASIDPQNLGVGSQKDAIASLSMSTSAKHSIKAKMMALRQGILNDFTKTTDIGTQAGYLPPPPMP